MDLPTNRIVLVGLLALLPVVAFATGDEPVLAAAVTGINVLIIIGSLAYATGGSTQGQATH